MYTNFPSTITYNSQKAETIQVFINRLILSVIYSYSGILFNHKKE